VSGELKKNDELEQVYLIGEGQESTIRYGERDLYLNRLKLAKRGGMGTKARS